MIEVKEIKTYKKRVNVNVIKPEWARYIEMPINAEVDTRKSIFDKIYEWLLLNF